MTICHTFESFRNLYYHTPIMENKFKTLCQHFSKDTTLIKELWEEIQTAHRQKHRYYHTLTHLEHIYQELEVVGLSPLLEFAIFYHDIVYEPSRNDNEEQSALLCEKCLLELNVSQQLIKETIQLIRETKIHEASSEENKLFLDADLSILSSDEKTYKLYIQNVRKEYVIYDDETYFKGRKKVLKMFLEKERIYKSKHFYECYEQKAHSNLTWELKQLSQS